ncbi:ATP-dependent DNA helicase [Brevibacillus sp. AY1]|uniref:ATP-dependent helicase n=1 Tax=Brevibacillus sp. AY1 TaxID=2807621 RepID=UPI002453DF15|nr:ATP-dependent DNA helicase [Brevibacillus sp. AY1]MDH4617378.1 ATP-dependent helicase [Brevibacillus sp. AY1]
MDLKQVLSENLTYNQQAAVLDDNENILCLACAGSGKSRTLAFRIAYLIATGCPPQSIVAFTFTDKAAESIKRRVADALLKFSLPVSLVGAMYIGTIHSYCQYLLGKVDAKYRQYEVLDENRFKLYLLSRYYTLGLNGIQNERNARMFSTIKEVADAWSTANDEALSLEDIENEDGTLGRLLKTIYQSLHRDKFIDFSLMIRLAVEELEKETPSIKESLKELKHILVDEYQDINPIQEKLIVHLKKQAESLLVVGDDDQSIYSWRGADVNNILSFQDRYSNCSTHILSTNFRSTNAIVQASDYFIQQELSTSRHSKNPKSHSDGNISDFKSLWFDSRENEARWVANRINELLGTKFIEYNADGTEREVRGLTPADFAILFRSIKRSYNPQNLPHKHHEFTTELRRMGLPYSLDAEGGIFERPHAVTIRNTMELLREPAPTREMMKVLFETVIISNFPNADFNEVAKVISDWNLKIHTPQGGARRKVYPQEFLHQIMLAFGVPKTTFDDVVMRDLGVFSSIILDIEKVYVSIDSPGRYREILNFLSNVAESGYDVSTLDVIAKPDAITISTIHKMKGLEYPVVFIVDVVNRRFPSDKSSYSGWLPSSLMEEPVRRGAYCTTRQDEARLFYTAMTRAERFLYITGSERQPDAKSLKKPSDFKKRIDQLGLSNDNLTLPVGIEKVPQKRRIDETLLPTSYSEIKEYMVCPMRYKLKKFFGFNPAVPELFGFGLTTHTIIEKLHQTYKNSAPSQMEVDTVAQETFHLKHIFPSNDPVNRPGPYERAYESAKEVVGNYVNSFGCDFERIREDEARFEINIGQALVSGAIDLLLKRDDIGNIIDAHVIDFKSLDTPDQSAENDWIDLSLQVQLYAHAANEVLGEKTKTGSVHLLKDNKRIDIPVSKDAITAAIGNINWAVERILDNDFPMRPCSKKCNSCDISRICSQTPQQFINTNNMPPKIHIPVENKTVSIRAFSEFED